MKAWIPVLRKKRYACGQGYLFFMSWVFFKKIKKTQAYRFSKKPVSMSWILKKTHKHTDFLITSMSS